MSEPLFRVDAYVREAQAEVLQASSSQILVDVNLFYPRGGGQPGDLGELALANGMSCPIVDTVYDADRRKILHIPANGAFLPQLGEAVTLRLDWATRYARMRAHTALHLLSVVLPYPVTGGSVGNGEGRLDFDSGETAFNRADIEKRINELVSTDALVRTRWITDVELDSNPGLIKTMKVKPPTGAGRVRLVEIEGLDLQPCSGTHVARVSEIGCIEVVDIEKKGKQNRRVKIKLSASGPA